MNKKLVGTICACIAIVAGTACALGYALGNSANPWYLIVFAGGIACAITSMIGTATREEDENKKHQKIIGTICASISMISVLIFLTVMLLTGFNNSWIIVCVGGVISGIIYMIDNAIKK